MGVCGMLIFGGAVLAASPCCNKRSIGTLEETRDLKYDSLVKQKEQKDGLDIYKTKIYLYSAKDVKCPLCKFSLPSEENEIINTMLNNGILKVNDLAQKYNNYAWDNYNIDIFTGLDKIYYEFDAIRKSTEENRYYKHICKKNAICQRTEDKAIYIDLIKQEVNYDFDKLLCYDHKKLKNDPEYKDEIVKERINRYNLRMKELRKIELERIYLPLFDENNIEKENQGIYQAKVSIDFLWNGQPKPGDFGYGQIKKVTASHLWLNSYRYVFYSGSKRYLLRYIKQLTGEDYSFSAAVGMSDRELEEFHEFIIKREPEYSTLI